MLKVNVAAALLFTNSFFAVDSDFFFTVAVANFGFADLKKFSQSHDCAVTFFVCDLLITLLSFRSIFAYRSLFWHDSEPSDAWGIVRLRECWFIFGRVTVQLGR